MRRILILFILSSINFLEIKGQTQWASKIVAVSSQKKGKNNAYKAEQVLGMPNVLSKFESSPFAWSPIEKPNREEFIHVEFEKPIQVATIAIYENFNAGSIKKVMIYSDDQKVYLVFENKEPKYVGKGEIFTIKIKKTDFKVVGLKLILDVNKVEGKNEIDAIGISSNNFMPEIVRISKNYMRARLEILPAEINSFSLEANPVLSPSGKRLYFTRLNHPENIKNIINNRITYKQDIWYADINTDGTFAKAVNIGAPLNNPQHNAAFTIAPDESYMLLNNKYLPDGKLEKGLSITRKTADGSWREPESLNIEEFINKSDFSEFWLTKDGKVLVMSIADDLTQGGNDLYVSFRKSENTFSKPVNMGKVINSAGEEATPWIDEDGKTLYFSSTGFSGFGDFDIFVSKRLDDTWTNWSEPENLGSSINTNGMDIYFSKQGVFGYYSSRGDIYKIIFK